MKLRKWVAVLLPVLVWVFTSSVLRSADGVAPPAKVSAISLGGGGDLFDPVFAIMNDTQGPDSMGCRGCHIGPQSVFGPWWGDDRDTVLATLENGMTPDGEMLNPLPLDGGRAGILGRLVHNGSMPLGGAPWTDDQIAVLDAWLQTYESP